MGLTLNEIRYFHWKPKATGQNQMLTGQQELQGRVGEALRYRYGILESDDYTPRRLTEEKFRKADELLNLAGPPCRSCGRRRTRRCARGRIR